MPGLQRNVSGCLSAIFIGALALAAVFVLVRPTPPLPDVRIDVPQGAPVATDSSATRGDIALPPPRPESGPASKTPAPEHRRRRHAEETLPAPAPPSERTSPTADDPGPAAPPSPRSNGSTLGLKSSVVENVTVLDRGERVVYRGAVDVKPTLERVAAGERLDFPDDGIVFQNRERRLPSRPRGYYHEYVSPTPNLPGPGPQRVVIGREGEVYYTPDHYRTFIELH